MQIYPNPDISKYPKKGDYMVCICDPPNYWMDDYDYTYGKIYRVFKDYSGSSLLVMESNDLGIVDFAPYYGENIKDKFFIPLSEWRENKIDILNKN